LRGMLKERQVTCKEESEAVIGIVHSASLERGAVGDWTTSCWTATSSCSALDVDAVGVWAVQLSKDQRKDKFVLDGASLCKQDAR
jgi:hypothetical protein